MLRQSAPIDLHTDQCLCLASWLVSLAGVILAAITFAAATLIPLMSSTKREAFGPFTPSAEMQNGRAAMLGFAALLVTEAVRGGAALFRFVRAPKLYHTSVTPLA